MFTVITDTSANIPTPMLRERNIRAIPFAYFMEGQQYTCEDTVSFDGVGFYDAIKKGRIVNTSQINPQTYQDFLEEELKAGRDALFVSMSSGISGSCNSARIAAEEMREAYPDRRVEVVDTMGASLGEGIIALHAADLRDAGMEVAEAAEVLRRLVKRMCQVFTVDDLMHLKRTGRLSNLSALVGTVLGIKPLLKGDETGHIVSFGKLRGRRRALDALGEIYNALVQDPENQTVGIAHANCPQDAEYLAGLLRREKPPKEILTVMYEPVTGSHVGPDTLALFFFGDEDCRGVRWPLEARSIVPEGLKSLGQSVGEKAGSLGHAVGEKTGSLVGAVSERAGKLGHKVSETTGSLVGAVSEKAGGLVGAVSEKAGALKDSVAEKVGNLRLPEELKTPVGSLHLGKKAEEKEEKEEETETHE